jgi:hypothetical protein
MTLTLGVRYDYFTPVTELDSLNLLPILQNHNAIQTILSNSTTDFAGNSAGRPLYRKDLNNFAPNVGFAWDPFRDGKTSFRAGYSISYVNDTALKVADYVTSTNQGLQTVVTQSGLTSRLSSLPGISVPAFQVPRTQADNWAVTTNNAVGMIDPNLVTPYVQQWTAGIQHAFGGTAVEIRYVGNHGVKLLRDFDYNQVIIGANGFLDDFLRARSNGFLAQAATGTFNPTYNPAIPGSQQLTVFPRLSSGGLLTNATVLNYLQQGQVGELANTYQANRLNGAVNFYQNPYALGANMLTNYSNSTYNGLQVEVSRRMRSGLEFQASYVYSRMFGDTQDDIRPATVANAQTRFEPFLDINNAKIERSRPAAFDLTHVLKGNAHYELPFGRGHRMNYQPVAILLSGWNVAGTVNLQSGNPFSVLSGRATLNRGARSTYNTANTNLTKAQLDQLFQLSMTPSGPYYVPTSILNVDGRAVQADGAQPFSGQVFFQPAPGTIGSLQRNYFSGPSVWDADVKIAKITRLTERQSIELRMDAYNVFNHPTWAIGDQTITAATFGKITGNFYDRRLIQFTLFYKF